MFSFFQRVIFELPQPITAKLRRMIGTCVSFINWIQKFGERSPQEIGGQKHAKFLSILYNLRYWSRISPERLYVVQNRKANVSSSNSSCVLRKRSSELWSTNYRDLDVSLDPLKCTFLGCALKFLHALEIEEGLLAHIPRKTGVPPKNFNCKNLKFGLKFSVLATITSGQVGVSPQNIFHTTCHGTGVITCV